MLEKYFNKNSIIALILVVTTVSMPLGFIPKKAEAQSINAYGSGLGLSAAISSLPLCKDSLNRAMTGLFSGIGSLFSSGAAEAARPGMARAATGSSGSIEEFPLEMINEDYVSAEIEFEVLNAALEDAAKRFGAIQVNDPNLNKKLHTVATQVAIIKEDTQTLKNNDSCLDGIGKLLAKMALQKITMSTVEWINNGFEGESAFVVAPGKFFRSIAHDEILQFGIEIGNPDLFPFGKAWMQNQANAFNNKFTDNARYSLNELIQETTPEFTAASFHEDFSQGGWSAWSYLTQIPANNPLGFQLMASNEIQKRLAGTEQSKAQEIRDNLAQASGFLGDERCVDPVTGRPNGVTKAEHSAALNAGEILCPSGQWEYVTPGSMIAQAATDIIGYPRDAFLDVEDLNDAVAAVTDAILAHFSNKWMAEGFASVNDYSGHSYFNTDQSYESQTEKDFSPIHRNTSSWLANNPNFNIRTDLTQALIDEQRTYVDKLEKQNKEIFSTNDGKEYRPAIAPDKQRERTSSEGLLTNAYGLLPAIYQLDYCMPGPHPGWENDSRQILSAAMGEIIPETTSSDFSSVEGAMNQARSLLPAVGSTIGYAIASTGGALVSTFAFAGTLAGPLGAAVGAILGFLIGALIDAFSEEDTGEMVRAYYASFMAAFTGYLPDYTNDDDDRKLNLSSKGGFTSIMNTILSRYVDIMNKTYGSKQSITPELYNLSKEAIAKFQQTFGYSQMMLDNENKIAAMKGTINILQEIKEVVDNMNLTINPESSLYDPAYTVEKYETDLKEHINAFGRISNQMVNGNDIAIADGILKQIKDQREYVYNDLLKGDHGCEAELEKEMPNFPSSAGSFVIDGSGRPGRDSMEGRGLGLYMYEGADWSEYNVNSVKRMSYPNTFPILYDYNALAAGNSIPDPWGECDLPACYKNNMPSENLYSTLGPGFLSFVFFTSEGERRRGPQRLPIHDLIPQWNNDGDSDGGEPSGNKWRAVGSRITDGDVRGGSFETVIGIY